MKTFNVFYTTKNGISLSQLVDAETPEDAAKIVKDMIDGCFIRKVKLSRLSK